MSAPHKYYCSRCDRFMYGVTLAELAINVNYHATSLHPSDFSNWTVSSIVDSANYSVPPSSVLPQYTEPYGTTSKRGSVLPTLTEDDKAMLAEAKISW